MRSAAERAKAFRALHERDGAFVIPNPVGRRQRTHARPTSASKPCHDERGIRVSRSAQRDNTVGRERMMAHVRDIVAATDLR
jgi:2-methylisocitrate lyase-like PEP mutase family enzyme